MSSETPQRAAIAAFRAAQAEGLLAVACYQAATSAYRRHCPEATASYCAREAVRVVLSERCLGLKAQGGA